MPNLNRVMLMGNLTRDPELRYTPSNMPIAKLGLAVNRKWKNQQGETQEEVLFVDCTAFGRTAEVVNQYLKKGRPVYIEGRLKLDQWQDKEGNKRSKHKVVIENFQFIDSKGGSEGGGGDEGGGGGEYAPRSQTPRPAGAGRPPASRPSPESSAAPTGEPHQPVEEDEIPF